MWGSRVVRSPLPRRAGRADLSLSTGAAFDPHHLHFTADGEAMLLADRGTFALAYPVLDGDDEGQSEAERTWVEE